jgi:hypothetical protein
MKTQTFFEAGKSKTKYLLKWCKESTILLDKLRICRHVFVFYVKLDVRVSNKLENNWDHHLDFVHFCLPVLSMNSFIFVILDII